MLKRFISLICVIAAIASFATVALATPANPYTSYNATITQNDAGFLWLDDTGTATLNTCKCAFQTSHDYYARIKVDGTWYDEVTKQGNQRITENLTAKYSKSNIQEVVGNFHAQCNTSTTTGTMQHFGRIRYRNGSYSDY